MGLSLIQKSNLELNPGFASSVRMAIAEQAAVLLLNPEATGAPKAFAHRVMQNLDGFTAQARVLIAARADTIFEGFDSNDDIAAGLTGNNPELNAKLRAAVAQNWDAIASVVETASS
jgi:hypothetical protein